MNMTKRQVLFDALKYSMISAPISYLAFFVDAGINSFSTDITGQFFNAVIENQYDVANGLLGRMLFTLLICVVVLPLIVLATNILFFYCSLKYDYHVTSAFYKKRYESMRKFSGGMIVQRLLRDPGQLLMLLATIPSKALAQMSAFVFTAFLMFRISSQLGTICVGFGLLGAVCPLIMKGKLARLDEASKKLNDQTSALELDMVQNRNFFKNYEIESLYIQKQEDVYLSYYSDHLKKGVWADAAATTLPEGLMMLGKIAFLLIGIYQVSIRKIGAGDLVAFFTYLTLMVSLITQIYNQTRQMAQLPDAIERILHLLNDGEKTEGTSLESQWDEIQALKLKYKYAADGPDITYEDFKITRNSLIEIQGSNGTGKTTLVLLLCGLLSPSSGTILIGKHFIEEVDLAKWWEHISIVEQIPAIFPGTVRENVRIGNVNASDEKVDSIMELLDLKEQEAREICTVQELSGGELKKVSIGRALLRDASIIVFDEPYEHLDAEGRMAIEKMLKDDTKTRILIQHRKELPITSDLIVQL